MPQEAAWKSPPVVVKDIEREKTDDEQTSDAEPGGDAANEFCPPGFQGDRAREEEAVEKEVCYQQPHRPHAALIFHGGQPGTDGFAGGQGCDGRLSGNFAGTVGHL